MLLLSGTLHSVLTSVFLMLEKLPKEPTMAMGRAAAKPREDVVRVPVTGGWWRGRARLRVSRRSVQQAGWLVLQPRAPAADATAAPSRHTRTRR